MNDKTMYKSLVLIMIKQLKKFPVFLEFFICTALFLLSRVIFFQSYMLCAAGFYIAVISKNQRINFLRIFVIFLAIYNINPPHIAGYMLLLVIISFLREKNKYTICMAAAFLNFAIESCYIINSGRYLELISLFLECIVFFLIGVIFIGMCKMLKKGDINIDSKTGLIAFLILCFIGSRGLTLESYIDFSRLISAYAIMIGAYAGGYSVILLAAIMAILSYDGVYSFVSTVGIYSFSSLCCGLGSRFRKHGIVLGFLTSNVIINMYSGGIGPECFSFFECLISVLLFYFSFIFLSYRIIAINGIINEFCSRCNIIREKASKHFYEIAAKYNRSKGLVFGPGVTAEMVSNNFTNNKKEVSFVKKSHAESERSGSLDSNKSDSEWHIGKSGFNMDYSGKEIAFSSVVHSHPDKKSYHLYAEENNKIKFYTHKEKEIYSKLKNMGIRISSVTVIKNQNDHFVTEIRLFACPGAEFCEKILDTVSATLGTKMSITEGTCKSDNDHDKLDISKNSKLISHFRFFNVCENIMKKYNRQIRRNPEDDIAKSNLLTKKSKKRTRCIMKMIQSKKINIMSSVAFCPKQGESISGDSFIYLPVANDKFLVALSDGMGSGAEAYRHSHATIEMLEQFLSAGLDKHNAIKMINSVLLLNKSDETFATIDVFILDLFSGTAEFLKIGAASSYIKNKEGVFEVSSCSLPAGILGDVDVETMVFKNMTDSYIVMLSDGAEQIDDLWVADFLRDQKNISPKILADQILKTARARNGGKDDITVVASYIS